MKRIDAHQTRSANPKSGRNVLTNWGSFVFTLVVNLSLTPFIVQNLGDTAYGIWILLTSVVGYMGLLDLGVRSAVMRYVSSFHAKGDDREASETASTGLAIFLGLGGLAFTTSLILARLLPSMFELSNDFVPVARAVVLIGGVAIVAALADGVFGGIVSAMQRFDLSSYLGIGIGIFRAIAIVVSLRAGYGLVALALIQLGGTLLRLCGNMALASRLYPELKVSLTLTRKSLVGPIFSFAAFSSILHVTRSVILSADAVVIGIFMPVRMITFYSIAGSLIVYTRSVVAGLAQTVTPRVSALQALESEEELRRVVLRTARVASLIVAPIAFTFLIRGGTFIGIWMGEDYVDLSGTVLWILSLSLFVTAPSQVLLSAMTGMNRHKLLAPFQTVEALLNLTVSVVLAQRWGINGVAWGTTLPTTLIATGALFWLLRKTLHISIGLTMREIWVRPALSVLPFVAGSFWMESASHPTNLVVFFAQVAATLPLALGGAWVFATSDEERDMVRSKVARILKGMPNPN